ncbi:DNRLRE domain-containing protein [Kiritimatiellota bacterium B12222]|nr:DNRLRE domain-containing protein [Kiritimatiellota bacterium B12222]
MAFYHTKLSISSLSLYMLSLASAAIITTSDDGYIREGQATTVQGGGVTEDLRVRSDGSANNDNVRKAYLKFDLTGMNADLSQSATFNTTISYRANIQNGNRIFYFYGLDAGFTPSGTELGTDWDETALTWNNAPANDSVTNIDRGFTDDASLIYTASNQYGSAVGKEYNITIPTLGDYVQADNTLTLMISWSDTVEYGFGSKENSTEAYRPTLEFATIPEPGSVVLMLIGAAGLLIFRRRK